MIDTHSSVGIDQWRLALFDADCLLAKERAKLLASRSSTLDYRFDIGITPLISACVGNNPCIVEEIIDLGASVEFSDDQGWTPLHWCAQSGREACAELLLRRRANPNSLTREDRSTPLHFSAQSTSIGVARLLIAYGANPFAREKPTNRTPIQAGAGRPDWLAALDIANLKASDCDALDMSALGWAVKGSDGDQGALLACKYWIELGARPSSSLSSHHPEIIAAKHGFIQTSLYLKSLREREEIDKTIHNNPRELHLSTRSL